MGFKVDGSFLKFLTMGALGVRRVAEELTRLGFEPIELERYCTSNKIWSTKIKRLRVPDLLCVRTGLRVEARAKSDLRIRVSDAPMNPDRAWDAGLRDEDLIALIACVAGERGPNLADCAVYFSVRSLRQSVSQSKLGPPKSASEGAERDRTWPAIVPSRPGRVLSVDRERIVVSMEGDDSPPRKQSYSLLGKHSYVTAGDSFAANVTMLAGAPRALADLKMYRSKAYDPLADLASRRPLDRFTAAKALRFRNDLRRRAVPALEKLIATEKEIRVALEAAASAAALGSAWAEDRIAAVLWDDNLREMSMEAILVLTELRTTFARKELRRAAADSQFQGDERRQAAIWGLGKAGLKAYGELIPYISDADENVAFHALAAFGSDTPRGVVETLVATLLEGDERSAAAASEALRIIGSPLALECLVAGAQARSARTDWAVATIGRLRPDMVRKRLAGTSLLTRLTPMLLLAPGASWLANEDTLSNMAFLLKQDL